MAKQNYTDDQIDRMREVYGAATTDAERADAMDQLAGEFEGKTVASIRSKLAHLGIYVAKAKPASKSTRVKKTDLVQQIADAAELENDSFFDSLEGANKAVLEWIIDLQSRAS